MKCRNESALTEKHQSVREHFGILGGERQTADKKQVGDARQNTAEILTTDFMEPYAAAALPPDSAFNRDTGIPRNAEKTLPCRLYRNTTEQKESFPPKDTSKEEPKARSHLYEDKKDGEKSSRPATLLDLELALSTFLRVTDEFSECTARCGGVLFSNQIPNFP
ncbi:hypothetical protein Bbelb_303700 [Branchiostoma belcheri]|nr:hypothetical protein Bbelb_303700 [Branchiostoma belcheri]